MKQILKRSLAVCLAALLLAGTAPVSVLAAAADVLSVAAVETDDGKSTTSVPTTMDAQQIESSEAFADKAAPTTESSPLPFRRR